MAARDQTIRISGLRETNRAFALVGREVHGDLKDVLREAAEPVRSDAERLASSGIRRIGLRWSLMRVGVTRSSVYVAPRQRGTKSARLRRPNFADLLMGRAMEPALESNRDEVLRNVDGMLASLERRWESA